MRRLFPPVYAVLWLLVSFPCQAGAEQRVVELAPTGTQPTVITAKGEPEPLYEQSHALVISVSNYQHEDVWPKLASVGSELDKVAGALRLHGFSVRRIYDPSGDELAKDIKVFMNTLGRQRNSRIVVFYSGHGHFDKETKETYLVPIDAMSPAVEGSNFFSVAYPMQYFRNDALTMIAKHGLFIFDNCYSGVVFKSSTAPAKPEPRGSTPSDRWRYLRNNSRFEVRQFISAGGPEEQLPAESIFADALYQALSGGADRTGDGYMTGKELGIFVTEQVTGLSRAQTPHSELLGKVLGDMIFQTHAPSVPALPLSARSIKTVPIPATTDARSPIRRYKTRLSATSAWPIIADYEAVYWLEEGAIKVEITGKARRNAKFPDGHNQTICSLRLHLARYTNRSDGTWGAFESSADKEIDIKLDTEKFKEIGPLRFSIPIDKAFDPDLNWLVLFHHFAKDGFFGKRCGRSYVPASASVKNMFFDKDMIVGQH